MIHTDHSKSLPRLAKLMEMTMKRYVPKDAAFRVLGLKKKAFEHARAVTTREPLEVIRAQPGVPGGVGRGKLAIELDGLVRWCSAFVAGFDQDTEAVLRAEALTPDEFNNAVAAYAEAAISQAA